MSKNTIYSYDYFQPEDYRFSLDSVFLPQRVAALIKETPNLDQFQCLDLCSGCGVIGLELNFHLPQIQKIDFLEVQESYLPYFEKNILQAKTEASDFKFLNMNYAELMNKNFESKYDLILSNPPYFFKEEGLLSPNEFKNRCRFFLDSDFSTLINAIIHALKIDGKAYLLIRPGKHHGRDLFQEMKQLVGERSSVQIVDEVRGTNVIELVKKS